MYCINCGKENDDNSKFCIVCGTSLLEGNCDNGNALLEEDSSKSGEDFVAGYEHYIEITPTELRIYEKPILAYIIRPGFVPMSQYKLIKTIKYCDVVDFKRSVWNNAIKMTLKDGSEFRTRLDSMSSAKDLEKRIKACKKNS